MKKYWLFVLTIWFMAYDKTAFAEWGEQYVMGKAGIMAVNINNANPLVSLGVLYGFGLTANVSTELELNASLTGGEYAGENDKGKFNIWTVAAYGVHRLALSQEFYLKTKVGVLYGSFDRDSQLIRQNSADGFGAAGGFGIGMIAGSVLTIELEATFIDRDVYFYSLGAHYRF